MGVPWQVIAAPFAAAIYCLAVTPLLASVFLGSHGFQHLATTPVWAAASLRSLLLSEVTVALSLPIGFAAALGLWGAPKQVRHLVLGVSMASLLTPQVWLGAGMTLLADGSGLPDARLAALIIAHTATAATVVLLFATWRLNHLDPATLQSAKACGASSLQAWRAIVIRALAWPLAASAAAAAALTFGHAALDQKLEPAHHWTLDAIAAAEPSATLLLASLAGGPLVILVLVSLIKTKF